MREPQPAQEITSLLKGATDDDKRRIVAAYEFAEVAHANQKRLSGEPYIVHAIETAKILAELGMDAETVTAGLLHDSLEDTSISKKELEQAFGSSILFLVESVTKLGTLKYKGADRHIESLRKLFLAMAQDIRVVIIKLADRLHNIRTLQYVLAEKRQRIALETLEIFAPIANRLGMGRLQAELEDCSFPYAYPNEFSRVKEILSRESNMTERGLQLVYEKLRSALENHGIAKAAVAYRVKHTYSLYKKLMRKDWDLTKVHDIRAVRIIVPTLEDCYRALGVVHGLWQPLPGRVKDYIATPKPNGYRSIHTSVFTGDGGIAEIQIRTEGMHQEAEYGIASHIAYDIADKPRSGGRLNKKLTWVQQLIDWQKQISESNEFLENLKVDFFQYRVFTFTPKGDVIELPENSSPIDFAYAIHSEIGDHIAGAKVNGKLVSLDTELKNGDIIEIVTSKKSRPSQKWLSHARTSGARKRIRNLIG
ncbi:MAG: bifunctional (p)ppGpp synthetase/guanosine-3',5'-bis(diphosphate) 3'-pyrophosphohydrolase [Candidatus Vogelbacteria bacterium]|nr:bifunctional (p)ppGpp synthetase/guanosine-3',5'-bis(diphosphate) 3'-pyrophosphohydrolase [Candidatus Vogelbacteria bacterium]